MTSFDEACSRIGFEPQEERDAFGVSSARSAVKSRKSVERLRSIRICCRLEQHLTGLEERCESRVQIRKSCPRIYGLRSVVLIVSDSPSSLSAIRVSSILDFATPVVGVTSTVTVTFMPSLVANRDRTFV